MRSKQDLLHGITQPEERLLLAKVLDQADFSLKKHQDTFTDFLSPELTAKALSFFQRQEDLFVLCYGGSEQAERQMLGFCPGYRSLEEGDFPICGVEIRWSKFSALPGHRDILGSVLGLGLERGKTGDIFLTEERALVLVRKEMAEYVATQLTKVGRAAVKCQVLEDWSALLPRETAVEASCTVASLRLDAVLSAVFPISRSQAQALLQAERVFLNHQTVQKNEKAVQEGDLLSVRGYGRVRITEIGGKTKKDRVRLSLLKYQ